MSFNRRMRMASPLYVERRGELARLLNEIDRLRNQIHDEFSTITVEDYNMFGQELRIVIENLKSLRSESHSRPELRLYNNRMREQIEDLEELEHDIKSFRVNAPKSEGLQEVMTKIGCLDFSQLF